MTQDVDRYFLTTPPMEFIRDLRDVVKFGDNLSCDRLLADISDLLEKYALNHFTTLDFQFGELMQEVEKFPASEEETALIMGLSELRKKAKALEEGRR